MKSPVECINPKARDAGWIAAFCPCPVCTNRRTTNEASNKPRSLIQEQYERAWHIKQSLRS